MPSDQPHSLHFNLPKQDRAFKGSSVRVGISRATHIDGINMLAPLYRDNIHTNPNLPDKGTVRRRFQNALTPSKELVVEMQRLEQLSATTSARHSTLIAEIAKDHPQTPHPTIGGEEISSDHDDEEREKDPHKGQQWVPDHWEFALEGAACSSRGGGRIWVPGYWKHD